MGSQRNNQYLTMILFVTIFFLSSSQRILAARLLIGSDQISGWHPPCGSVCEYESKCPGCHGNGPPMI
ncbi:hypothetical protein BDE02_04G059700 [Populus trichocarpa]|uniref:Transmembrane protein n=1 Tax=Populus trichocarpa TaxID=3694 RepID=A9PAW7_POPTR|nr:unknown [Populus trichocarpa]KAI5591156.1 hypothetical protein BDE02_04G059700 [Populus trichocarpa]